MASEVKFVVDAAVRAKVKAIVWPYQSHFHLPDSALLRSMSISAEKVKFLCR